LPEEALDFEDDAELIEPMRYLSRILTWFRGEGYGDIARSTTLIDRAVVGPSEMAGALRDFLLEEGALVERGSLYILDRERLGELGINWNDVRTRTISHQMRGFLRRFIERTTTRRAAAHP
jgi:hypothetical protein